jgi:hypothetical protein
MTDRFSTPNEKEIVELLKSMRPLPSKGFYLQMKSSPWARPSHLNLTIRANLRSVLALSALIALLFVALFTSVGSAIADGIVAFFTTSKDESFQVSEDVLVRVTEHVESSIAGRTPTPTPIRKDMGAYADEISKVEQQLGYGLKVFSEIPAGLTFSGIGVFPEKGIISIGYESKGGHLTLKQGLGIFPEDGEFDQVPSHEIQLVMIGEYPGEYVQGDFIVLAGETDATWVNDLSIQRLRWREDDRWFEIGAYISPDKAEYLDMYALIRLAESLVYSQ